MRKRRRKRIRKIRRKYYKSQKGGIIGDLVGDLIGAAGSAVFDAGIDTVKHLTSPRRLLKTIQNPKTIDKAVKFLPKGIKLFRAYKKSTANKRPFRMSRFMKFL